VPVEDIQSSLDELGGRAACGRSDNTEIKGTPTDENTTKSVG
jgi:hypothetical protein